MSKEAQSLATSNVCHRRNEGNSQSSWCYSTPNFTPLRKQKLTTKWQDSIIPTINNLISHPSLFLQAPVSRMFDFDEEKVPVSQQLGDFTDKTFGFIFNPNVIKFGIYCLQAFALQLTWLATSI
jgi:hypothetical protein